MKKMIAAFAVTLTLLTSGSAYATDAGVIAATLPDEAAECRYLTQLAEKGRGIAKELKSYTATPSVTTPEGKRVWQAKTREEQDQWIAGMNELIARDAREFAAFDEALRVIRAKHEHMPTCFEAFADVYDLDTIR